MEAQLSQRQFTPGERLHVGDAVFGRRHKDQVVLEFAVVAFGAFETEDVFEFGGRLPQVGGDGRGLVVENDEQRAGIGQVVGDLPGTRGEQDGVEFASRQVKQLVDAVAQIGANLARVHIPHVTADHLVQVSLGHETQRRAGAVV